MKWRGTAKSCTRGRSVSFFRRLRSTAWSCTRRCAGACHFVGNGGELLGVVPGGAHERGIL